MARRTGAGAGQWLYCLDCHMLDYPVEDASTMHGNCNIYRFGKPANYVPPIAVILMKLDADIEITKNELIMFKLAIALHGPDPKEWKVKK